MNKTLSRLEKAFYWPGMKNDTRRYIQECDKLHCKENIKEGKGPYETVPDW